MRRHEREITDRVEIDEIIMTSMVCRLAFAYDNEPYLVPVNFGYDGSSLYFHTANVGKKLDFIARNSRICFEVENNVRIVTHPEVACKWSCTYESVIGYGRISELVEDEEKRRGLNVIMDHYSGKEIWEFDSKVLTVTRVWKIHIDSLTGKRSNSPG